MVVGHGCGRMEEFWKYLEGFWVKEVVVTRGGQRCGIRRCGETFAVVGAEGWFNLKKERNKGL